MADTKFYFDFNFPLKVVQFILGLILGRPDPNNPAVIDPASREWFSQPRAGTDAGTECVTTLFKLPLSISELSLEILRVPCIAEVFYQDRSNNWRPVLDTSRIPLRVSISYAGTKSYYKYAVKCYPIVAKQLQIRLTRVNDTTLENAPYVVGLRNCLIRRNVYDRSQGSQYFEDEVDILGNVITKYIKDWDASKAADDNPTTFWKSAPMPDPAAVTSLYLDVRGDVGEPKTIDRLYLDPVYTGCHLNLYYSSDDTVGTRRLSPITVNPDVDENTDWRQGRGRSDTSTGVEESFYRFSFAVGPQVSQAAWIGVEWTPDFDPTDGPPQNPILYRNIVDDSGLFHPSLEYDVGAGQFNLNFDDGTDTRTYGATVSPLFALGETLRIVTGWRYDPDTVYLSVINAAGVEIAHIEDVSTTLPQTVSFDGQSEIFDFRGTMTALIVKLEDYRTNSTSFQNSATYYVDPDPVIPDPYTGVVPSTTLDNAIYAVDWTTQQDGSGGAHDSAYEDKEWTPIWRNYVTEKGMLFFPQALTMKYLKLEFTNLCEQPYPIYESGIETRYRVYPTSVLQQSSIGPRLYTGEGGFLGLGTFISVNGVKSVNWLNPLSVISAVGSVLGPQTPPVTINQQGGFTTETLPNQDQGPFAGTDQWRLELASSYIYRRDALNPFIVSEDAYVTIIKAEGLQQLATYTDVPWQDIEAANPGAITHVRSTGTLPIRGTDWWIYPGQQLKVPASVMTKLTATDTITERKLTLEHRVRFNTTSVHRYDYKTIRRDAAMAYFAAVREVIPFTTTFIPGEDRPYFDFPAYDPDQFVLQNTRALESGPTTVDARTFDIENPSFVDTINPWAPEAGTWNWDGTDGHWFHGSAHHTATGVHAVLRSTKIDAVEGDELTVSCWVKWSDLVVVDNEKGPYVALSVYDSSNEWVSDVASAFPTFADWSTHTDSDWIQLTGSGTVPAGADHLRLLFVVPDEDSAGDAWFDNGQVFYTLDTDRQASLSKSLETTSTFAKVAVDFKDSGLWRSDSMWADINPDSESIPDTKLAPYTSTIPETIPGGFWSDTTKTWSDDDAMWGSPYSVISIVVDNNRIYDGKRVLHFRRAAGAGESGIKVTQWTNYVPLGLFRIGAVFYKPVADDNQITVRLRRLSDGVIVYEETITPPTGRWHRFESSFVEIPDMVDQQYEVSLTLSGDDEDELYLSDLYTEVANIRYFVRLGGVGATLHEVTDLRYIDGRANVTVTTPVNQMTIQAVILSPKSWVYGCRLTPTYLR